MVAVILAYDNEMIFINIMNGIQDFLVKKAEMITRIIVAFFVDRRGRPKRISESLGKRYSKVAKKGVGLSTFSGHPRGPPNGSEISSV